MSMIYYTFWDVVLIFIFELLENHCAQYGGRDFAKPINLPLYDFQHFNIRAPFFRIVVILMLSYK